LNERLILLYAPLDASRKRLFTAEMELAALVCLAEAKRKKKGGILHREEERMVSISKLYYPVWLIPLENDYVTVDGMTLFSFRTIYDKPQNYASFTAEVEAGKKSYEQLFRLLTENLKIFRDFAAKEEIVIDGVIQDKELQAAILECFRKEVSAKESQVRETAFLSERLNKKTAVAKANEIAELLKKDQLDIEALQGIVSILDDATETINTELLRKIENVKQEYSAKIDELRPVVEEKIGHLTKERDEKTRTIIATTDRELEARAQEQAEYDKELETLGREKSDFEEKKQLAKMRKDELYIKSWKIRVKEREKRISALSKKTRKLQEHIDKTKKEKEKSLKQTNETYDALITTEADKIPALEAARDNELRDVEESIEQVRSQAALIVQRISVLLEEKEASIAKLKEAITPWKLEGVVLLYVPFYVLYYLAESKERYEFHAPVLASSPEGLLKKIRQKLWGFSLESRLGVLLRERSKALDRMFSSTLSKQIEEDSELRNQIREKNEQNNIFLASNFKNQLTKGIEELVKEEWVKPEERDMILKMFTT
jgi:hypothetical protein